MSPAQTPTLQQPASVPNDQEVRQRFVDLFTPFRTERASMSPDGKYLAYTVRANEAITIFVVEIDNPAKATAKVIVATDEAATPMLAINSSEKTPAAVRWMRWVTSNRLVVETNKNYPFKRTTLNPANADLENSSSSDIGGDWLNFSGEILALDANGANAKVILTPQDISEFASSHSGKAGNVSTPRSPHIVDLADDDTESVLVHAEGLAFVGGRRYAQWYKLNTVTGKRSEYSVRDISVGRSYLFTRQGYPSVSISTSTVDPMPHEFTVTSTTIFKGSKTLDQMVASDLNTSFRLSPENYFGQRSIPIGFGRDPQILYYASNVGRNTYGIYSMDLATGKKTTFCAENPVYDLYFPMPGAFPDTNQGTFLGDTSENEITSPFEEAMQTTGESVSQSSSNPQLGAMQASQRAVDEQMAAAERQFNAATSYIASVARKFSQSNLLGNVENNPLVFDRFTHDLAGFRYEGNTYTCSWFNPQIAETQQQLERRFPGKSVDILEWDRTYSRFLVRVRGTVDSGAFYVYDKTGPNLREFLQRAPNLSRAKLDESMNFSIKAADGRLITGIFTFPREARSLPVPLVLLCQPLPWSRVHAEFQPEVQAFAAMGFAVLQVNARGVWGYGLAQREAVRDGYEQIQLNDMLTAVDSISKRFAVNRRRVAIVGCSHGGYLALRALQLFPDRFRCAVAFDSIIDIKAWLEETRWSSADSGSRLVSSFFGTHVLEDKSELLKNPNLIKSPVLLLNYRGEPGKGESMSYVKAKSLKLALARNDVPAELYDLSEDYVNGLPNARAGAFQAIENFLNTYIYDFKVKMGELKVIKED